MNCVSLWRRFGTNLVYECDFGITLVSLLTREGDFGATLALLWGDFPHIYDGDFGATLGALLGYFGIEG